MSEVGDDIYSGRDGGENSGKGRGKGPSLTQRVEQTGRVGRNPTRLDKRKFTHDRAGAALAGSVQWHTTRDDRMDAVAAGQMLERLHKVFGIHREQPEFIEAFNTALFFCHTVNSGSILQPARSMIVVDGNTFDYVHVVKVLGNDMRRFYRAFADEIADVNSQVIKQYDPNDLESAERHSWLMDVATDRGLLRFPYLAHDSSDKCTNLSPVERVAVNNSKRGVFASIINAVDPLDSNGRASTSDEYDSTNMRVVPRIGTGDK